MTIIERLESLNLISIRFIVQRVTLIEFVHHKTGIRFLSRSDLIKHLDLLEIIGRCRREEN